MVDVTLEMTSYIAHPFWPETNQRIEVEKKSGVNRQKSEEKRIAALKAECTRRGITYDDYLKLVALSQRQWYTRDDGSIYIPRHHIAGGLVQVIGGSPKSLRGRFTKDNFRALVQISDFSTDQRQASGVFGRFVKLDSSNQRSWQQNEYLGVYLDKGEPFLAEGQISCAEPKDEQTVKALFMELVCNIGIGAARKMGFGRGNIIKWT
jgi:hypothetical protein